MLRTSFFVLLITLVCGGCSNDDTTHEETTNYTAAPSMCQTWGDFAYAVVQSSVSPPPQLADIGISSKGFVRASFRFSECVQQWQFQVTSATLRNDEPAAILLQEFTSCVEPGTNVIGVYGECDPDWVSSEYQVFVEAPFVDAGYTYNDSVSDPDKLNRFNLSLEVLFKGELYTVGLVPGQLSCFSGEASDCRACADECATRECGRDGCGNVCGVCDTGICVNGQCSTSSTDANECDQCLSGCQGSSNCCTGSGCLCYEECSLNNCSGEGVELCCASNGDCFCMPPAQCPY